MLHPSMAQVLASEHTRDLHQAAARNRLAHLATCCRPSYLRARLAELRGRVARRADVAVCCA